MTDQARIRAMIAAQLPEGTWRRRVALAGRNTLRHGRTFARDVRDEAREGVGGALPISYRGWRRINRPRRSELAHHRRLLGDHPHGPTVHVVVRGGADVSRTVGSLERQSWPTWRATVESAGIADDDRIRFGVDPAEAVLDGDPDDLVVVLDAGDELRADAVFWIVDRAWSVPESVLVHWDDDVRGPTGPTSPRLRPGWSPTMLLSANYLGRSFAVRRSALAGGTGIAGSDLELWDCLLGLELDHTRVERIAEVLATVTRRPDAVPVGAAAVLDPVLERRGIPAVASEVDGALTLRWDTGSRPSVTVVIPTRHNRTLVGPCLRSVAAAGTDDVDVVVIDNGERTDENEAWYEQFDLDLTVDWWTDPFNYSAVNNRGAELARGEVLVFLNDDTEILDPGWLDELCGWATRPDVGVVGVQLLDPDGLIQHGGVIMGIRGFADHLFAAMEPASDTLVGSTTWYRNCSAVTGACLAVTRARFDQLGGFDERFELCGSDVALGLQAVLHGLDNVVTPRHLVLHRESATRENWVPVGDLFASWWRYQRFVRAGDRWWSPSLSLRTGAPALRVPGEPDAIEWVSTALGRDLGVFRQGSDDDETHVLVSQAWLPEERIGPGPTRAAGMPSTVNWWFPDLDSPFYGGINTALRLADHLAATHGVENRLVIWGLENERWIRSGVAAAFPRLADVPISFVDGSGTPESLAAVPDADASIASLWITAYHLLAHGGSGRRFYLVQDYEPMFYPAGSLYALAEETYRFGLHAICNTDNLRAIMTEQYGGTASSFWPAVDRELFNPKGRRPVDHDGPVRVFVYARPGHWRNCWEMARAALIELKRQHGEQVHIVTAGSWARPDDLGMGIEHLGMLDLAETADLYRTCDIGVALTVSAHPSYLPLELMACGTPVVAFDNPAGYWVLDDGRNSVLCRRTVTGLHDALESLVVDPARRAALAAEAERTIDDGFSDWEATGDRFAAILADPEATARVGPAVDVGEV